MTRIIDLCAGSGMLARADAYALGCTDPTILSIDIDPAALAVCAARGRPRPASSTASTSWTPSRGHWSNEFRDGIIRP